MRAKQYKIKISKGHYLQANNGKWYTDGKMAILSSLTDQNIRAGELFRNGQREDSPSMPDITQVLPTEKGPEFSEICGLVGEIEPGNYARFFQDEKTGRVVALNLALYNEISAAAFPTSITWAGIKESGAFHPVAFWSGEELTAVLMPVDFSEKALSKSLAALKSLA